MDLILIGAWFAVGLAVGATICDFIGVSVGCWGRCWTSTPFYIAVGCSHGWNITWRCLNFGILSWSRGWF